MKKPEPAAAKRLGLIPPYLFQELDDLKARTKGDLIDLGEGSPDQPTPVSIRRAFERALLRPENHRYPTYAGRLSTRQAVADWYRRRFGVKLEPDGEVCMLIGSKEGVGHLRWGTCGPGDRVGVTDPNYPIYPNQTRLAGARPVTVPLRAKNGFLPELSFLEKIGPGLKLLCLNFPNNPTAGVADLGFFREIVALARRHGFYVLNDCVYSELYFGRKRPPSILQVPGAKDRCIEFHSLSKTFNMAGWRIGMAVGNRELIRALLRIKQNTDSGPFGAIQEAGAYALRHSEALAAKIRSMYRKRRDTFCEELAMLGWDVNVPEATFYVWTKTPVKDDYGFVLDMLENCRVVAAPGSGFGRFGRGFVRFALVESEQRLRRAARRIGKWIGMKGRRGKGAKG
jgi:LL-diaminopimelate aminotransferase